MPDPSIFICYTGPDRERAKALHAALSDAGLRPWCDDIDLVPGQNWDEAIPAALKRAALVAVIVSPNWPVLGESGRGHYDREEVAFAIRLTRQHGTVVVPILIDGAGVDRVPYGLARVREVTAPGEDWSRVATELRRALQAAPTRAEASPATLREPDPPEVPEQPYPVLRRYQHPDHFAGRDADITRLLALIDRPRMALVRLHAVSGAGKSSLLEAGLVPALRGRGVPVAYLRDPDRSGLVRRALSQLVDNAPSVDDDDARGIYDGFDRVRALAGHTPVVVLDQFEEVFKRPDPGERATALARVGFALAAAGPPDGVGPPAVRWVLAYRDDFHGPVDGWLPNLLDAAVAEGWPVQGLGDGFVRDEHRVDRVRLEPLGGRCDGYAFDPPDAIEDDPIASAFLAAIRGPSSMQGAPWQLDVPDADAERLARAFAAERRRRPDDPLAPELQVVLQRCLTRDDAGRYTLRVGERAESDIAEALRAHLRQALLSATDDLDRSTAEQTRQATLDALAELTDAGVRRNAPQPRAWLVKRIGDGADGVLRALAGPKVRILIEQRPRGEDDAPVCRLSHDRLAAAVEDERAAAVTVARERDFLRIADLVRRCTRDFEANDQRATALDRKTRARVEHHAAQLVDTPGRERWWAAVQRRAQRTRRIVMAIAALAVIAAGVGGWQWQEGRARQRITDRLESGDPSAILLGVAEVIARDGDHTAADPFLPPLGEGQDTPGRTLARDLLAEAFPADISPASECAARAELVGHYAPHAAYPEDFGMLLAAVDRMDHLDTAPCRAARDAARKVAVDALRERYGEPDAGLLASLEWRPIPPGDAQTFECVIGSPESEPGRDSDEAQRTVTLSRFEAMATEVTQGQYLAFLQAAGFGWKMRTSPDGADPATLPAANFDWYQATAFAAWVGGRLPTEAEWECMARAETETAYWWGDGEAALKESGWYVDNSGGHAHSVGQKPPNTWGLFDVHGNLWEWTADWYAPARPAEGARDPRGPAGGGHRALRGGSFGGTAHVARAANRDGSQPDARVTGVGFRVVRPTPAR